jgi:hypothetical protein
MSNPVTPTPPTVPGSGGTSTSVPQQATPPKQTAPNQYSVQGSGITVSYGWFGSPEVMTYQDSSHNLAFTYEEVTETSLSALGSLVTVTIVPGTETVTTFTLLLPPVVIPGQSGSVPIETLGITTVQAASGASASPQKATYSVVNLSGNAVSTGDAAL